MVTICIRFGSCIKNKIKANFQCTNNNNDFYFNSIYTQVLGINSIIFSWFYLQFCWQSRIVTFWLIAMFQLSEVYLRDWLTCRPMRSGCQSISPNGTVNKLTNAALRLSNYVYKSNILYTGKSLSSIKNIMSVRKTGQSGFFTDFTKFFND